MKTVKGSIDVGRFRVPYRMYGESPRYLLCVSGALQTMVVWRSFVKKFSDHYTCITFDMPGTGRSDILSGPAKVGVDEQLNVLAALVEEATDGKPVALAGSSWGTVIAAGFAAIYPEKVERLLLGSFALKPNATMLAVTERAKALYESGDWAQGADLIIEVFGTQIAGTYKKKIAAQFKGLSSTSAEAFYEHCMNIATTSRLEDLLDLSRITAQTLIINGADDTIIDLDDMHKAAEMIPNCETILVENAGHFLHFEQPELLELYAEFMVPDNPAIENVKSA